MGIGVRDWGQPPFITYNPFGKVLTQTGTLNAKRGYTGHEEDVDTGLVYAEARYYSPTTQRFTQQDPSHVYLGSQNFNNIIGIDRKTILLDPQQLNSYSYVRNNPITLSDPSGKTIGDIINGGGLGFLQGLGDVVVGSLYAITNPIETARYVAKSVAHVPQNAVDAYNGFKNGDDFTNGYVLGNVGAQIFLSIKGAEAIKSPTNVTVGRWMTEQESAFMDKTGQIKEGSGGVTSVSVGGPTSYLGKGEGGVYREFDVPKNSLVQGGKPNWFTLVGKNANKIQQNKLQLQGGKLLQNLKPKNLSKILSKKIK